MSTRTGIATRPFGNTGMDVTLIGLGAGQIGQEEEGKQTAARLLNAALDDGLRVIDTAECYGIAEDLIGEHVSHRRDEFFLFTKTGHGKRIGMPDWDPKTLATTIEQSLQRLRADYVDLLQLHTCGKEKLQQGDVIEVIQRAKEQGKARFIGYSGDGDDAIYAIECGAFDTLQISVNVADQEAIDRGILQRAKERGMGVLAKRSVANASWQDDPNFLQDIDVYQKRLDKLNYKHLERMPVEDAVGHNLRFTLSVPGVDCALVGTKDPNHWLHNLRYVHMGPLSTAEYEAIRGRWSEVKEPDWVGQG
jgi:aryl-alcohol dehydrogenase-like predicted oxidoreductase